MKQFRRNYTKGASQKKDSPTILDKLTKIKASESCALGEAFIIFVHTIVVAAISDQAKWRFSAVLKGGTGLKLYLGESIGRVSKDLDFTLRTNESVPFNAEDFQKEIPLWCKKHLKRNYSDAASIELQLIGEPDPTDSHKTQLYTYRIRASLNRGDRSPLRADENNFKIEIATAELLDTNHITVIRQQVNGMAINIESYDAIQMMAEKLRAILQKCKKYEEWNNPASLAPRHVLDLIPLMKITDRDGLSLDALPSLFHRKCEYINIPRSYCTRGRMLHPVMRERVVDGYPNGLEAWDILEKLVEKCLGDG